MPIRRIMELSPTLLQFIGSLVAILALAGLARWMQLGPEARLDSDAAAQLAADEAVSGYVPVEISRDEQGRGALMRDGSGRILLLRPHGTHMAGRLLTPAASARIEGDVLVVDTAERRYGAARLRLADAQAWMRAIAALGDRTNHA